VRKPNDRGRNPDDLERLAVDPRHAADDTRISRVLPPPEAVADDGDAVTAVGPLVLGEAAPEPGRYAEHREEGGRDASTLEPDRTGPGLHAEVGIVVGGDSLDRPLRRGELAEVGRRRRKGLRIDRRVHRPDRHQPVRIGIGQRPDDDRIEHADDRRGGADAEGEGERRSGREPRVPAQRASREAEVLPQHIQPMSRRLHADLLLHGGDVAELLPRRRRRVHRLEVEVEAELVVDLPLGRASEEECAQAVAKSVEA
jgi:hypothetical protein